MRKIIPKTPLEAFVRHPVYDNGELINSFVFFCQSYCQTHHFYDILYTDYDPTL